MYSVKPETGTSSAVNSILAGYKEKLCLFQFFGGVVSNSNKSGSCDP